MILLSRVLRFFLSHTFRYWEFLGIHITPNHFYSPIPSLKELDYKVFDKRSECVGIDWNVALQVSYLKKVFPKFSYEVEFKGNIGLSLVDAAILHSMIRYYKPPKMIEIGGGESTKISARACLMNKSEGHECEFFSIEPYPPKYLPRNLSGLTKLIRQKVQSIDVDFFKDCDILFIDSSHIVKIGSDVNYEILEILPRLKSGCLIHFHDIVLPGEYWEEWIMEKCLFFTEQYLLWAFLLFNSDFEIVWASRYMHINNCLDISNTFSYFLPEKHHIMSFWIRRK